MPEEATEIPDKQLIYCRRFDKRLRDQLKTLITPELIDEHRAQAARPALRRARPRVLNYFRRGEMPDKYAILRIRPLRSCTPTRSWRCPACRGAPPRLVDDQLYPTLDEAYHAVFLLRVNDLLES